MHILPGQFCHTSLTLNNMHMCKMYTFVMELRFGGWKLTRVNSDSVVRGLSNMQPGEAEAPPSHTLCSIFSATCLSLPSSHGRAKNSVLTGLFCHVLSSDRSIPISLTLCVDGEPGVINVKNTSAHANRVLCQVYPWWRGDKPPDTSPLWPTAAFDC